MLGYRVSLNGQCERHKYSQPFSPPPIASHQLQRSSPVKVKGEDSQRPKPSPADPLPILTSGMIAITPTLVIHILAVSRFRNKSHNYTKYFVCASILTPSRPSQRPRDTPFGPVSCLMSVGDTVNIWQSGATYFQVQFQIFQRPNDVTLRTSWKIAQIPTNSKCSGMVEACQVTMGKTRN